MTEIRARIVAQAIGFLMLAMGATAHAVEANIDITSGAQSLVDGACVAPIPFFNGLDCSYNSTNPTGSVITGWQGPLTGASYYAVGDSPYVQVGVGTAPTDGDPLKAELPVTGTIDIEDNGTPCDADDTIAGNIILGAGTRAFAGGPGENGEETWGAGDIQFPFAAITVDSATVNGAGGCDYEIASAGFPPRLQEAAGAMRLYPVDVSVDAPGFWVAPSPVGMAEVSEGNAGVMVTVTVGPGLTCTDNTGGGGACANDGSHFGGTRAILESFLVSISTDGNGDVTLGQIYANNEAKIFNVPPDPFNSWDGPRIEFQGQCQNCKLARDDNYEVIVGTPTIDLNIGANDSAILTNPTVTITTPPDPGSSAMINGSGGAINAVTATYVPAGTLGAGDTDSFVYEADDTVNPVSSAVVTINIVNDENPVANPVTLTLSTVGVDPSSLTGQFNALTDSGNSAGNGGTVSNVTAAGNGTSDTDGTNVTYVPNATFFSGTDTFMYTIDDPVTLTPPDTATGTVTVNIADASPTASNGNADTDGGVPVDVAITVGPGNGTIAQHTVAITSDATGGTCVLNGANDTVTYTPDDDFSGDDECTYTITDADGSAIAGLISLFVNESNVTKKPGGNAIGPWALVMLLALPLLRRRRYS